MKELLQQFATYNIWANDRIINSISQLPLELVDKPVESSFSTLRLTALHLWETELAWWRRVHAVENVVSSPDNKTLSVDEIFINWKKQSLQWQQWIINAKEADLSVVLAYRNLKNEEFKQPVYQIILHVFNHATYHRGQIVTIFHQLKVNNIPNTDFINWSRTQKK